MDYHRFIRALKNRLGNDINIYDNGHGSYCTVYNGYDVSWTVNTAGEAHSFHTKGVNQKTDMMTDYYPGTWWKNSKQMLDFLSPPPPKFSSGDLVRFKDVLRNRKQNLAGKTDLVVEITGGRQYRLMNLSSYIEPIYGSRMSITFSENDLELVK